MIIDVNMESQFKVITLNCWGIYVVSKDRVPRMQAIAEELATGKYHFVFLQEIWCQSDYNRIKNKVSSVLPYSHYFHSGIIGSGLCIFSVSEINNILYHPWSLNGYIHKIQHGDWFGGKGIGLCEVSHHGARILLYTTHLHAEYDSKNDQYLAHRVAQAWEASQFIKVTSREADMVILGGDLNSMPQDVSLRVFLHNSGLRDAWQEANQGSEDCGGTCDTPRNSYTAPVLLTDYPSGKRIDYVLHKSGYGKKVHTESCSIALPSRAPDLSVSFSDHEAVVAHLKLVHQPGEAVEMDRELQAATVKESMEICEQGANRVTQEKFFWGKMAALTFICILSITVPGGVLSTLLLSFLFGFCLIMATLWNNMEVKGLMGRKLEMEAYLNSITTKQET